MPENPPPVRVSWSPARPHGPSGVTLLELLVSIAIIAVLVIALLWGTRAAMFAVQKANDTRQMRAIGAAVMLWAGDKNYGEPMYFANGTGDFAHEALPGRNAEIAPGNPAKALYVKGDPENSYIQTPSLFFSPLTTVKAPATDDYDPAQTGAGKYWGTYIWVYPSTTLGQMTRRQFAASGGNSIPKISPEANKNVLMANSYLTPRFERVYHALFLDGSVRMVANSPEMWTLWFNGE